MKKVNYLPSKKFIIITLGIFMVLGLIFFFANKIKNRKNSNITDKKEIQEIKSEDLTIKDLIQKDSDSDGVYDWEEALWGLDPNNKSTNEGISDEEFLKNKRASLQAENGAGQGSSGENLNQTEKFSKEFLTTLSALQQSGQADETTVNNISGALAQKIIEPAIIDQYNDTNIIIASTDNITAQKEYYGKIQKLFQGYSEKNLGDELAILSQIISTYSTNKNGDLVQELNDIGAAYQDFGEKMLEIPVPKSLSSYTLSIVNASNNTGISVKNMAKVLDDPIIGLSGLAQYQKYSNDLISEADNLKTYLLIGGIIAE